MSLLGAWWVWFAGAVIFGILETLAPVFVFLGFSAGAAVVGLGLLIGIGFGGSLAAMAVVFAFVSLVVTILLRRVLGSDPSETQTFVDDIND